MSTERIDLLKSLKDTKTIVIKIGSARVSTSPEKTNDFLYGLVGEIRALRDQGKKVILVSSGAIAQGKRLYSKIKLSEPNSQIALAEKQAFAAMGQNRLMNLYESFFSRVNIPIAQILFGRRDLGEAQNFVNLKNTFQQLLDWGVLPIVNENDSISTEEINLGDNDVLSSIVTATVGAEMLIILTSVDGYLKDGKPVPFLQEIGEAEEKYALGPSGPGTGGMMTKLKAAKYILPFGMKTVILNGERKNIISQFFQDPNIGTLIANPKINFFAPTEKEVQKRFFQ
ncbi:gamma-glutamyl kinase [Leptospira ryugenii]|uniref:Glutamate 5-kinase n=1 Tax=Leptospira ryugenii TaxID=1917863 RepID=A0A2P2DX29_9LEPT|nr:glutamate 5-kinase [Leptospira ryugenii]GBF49166.1 gamma-glutamyl kinase [Leptospira ryugenii]